jgi:hypothetical protein
VLGISDLDGVLASTPSLDHVGAMAAAAAWVAKRDPGEQALRKPLLELA